jgi:hypothetical protein
MALEIAELLKDEIARGEFKLSAPIRRLPLEEKFKPMAIKESERYG